MIRTEMRDDRVYTYSDAGMKILQVETGIVYEDALDVAKAEFYSRVSAFLSANNRAMWTVTLERADGRQIMRESYGAMPDMTPVPEPEPETEVEINGD